MAWIGDLPESWSLVPLKQRTTMVSRGRSPDYSEDDEGIPVINQACIYWEGIRYDNVKRQRVSTMSGERGRLYPGDLVMNSTGTGTLGRAALFDRSDEYLADSHVTVIRTTEDALPSFVRYVLQTDIYQGYVYSVLAPGATNQIELSREGLRRTPFPMPPVDEQLAIASFLDRKTTAIDALLAKKEHLVELLHEKKQTFIAQAVTKGLVPNALLKDSGVDRIGHIPSHWKVVTLRRLARVGQGDAFAHAIQGQESGALPWFKVADMNRPGNEIEMVSADNYVDHEVATTAKATIFPAGAVIFPRVGAALLTNKRRILSSPSIIDDNTYAVVPGPSIRSRFLYLCLLRVDMAALCSAGLVPTVTFAAIKELSIGLPPLEEQDEIIRVVETTCERLDTAVRSTRRSIDLLQEYRQALITAAVTGKIDPLKEAA